MILCSAMTLPPATPPDLTDRPTLARHRARASAFFLHDLAIAEIQERLTEVNKVFTAPAVVSGFAKIWGAAFPGARVVADDDLLALEPGAHDLVIHGQSLHWAADPVGQLVQCRRALAPDGLMIAVMFGGQTLTELRAVLAEAEAAETGGLSPRVLPMAEVRDLGGLLQRAGFALPVADVLTQRVSYRDTTALMHDLRAMGEGNALTARLRHPTGRRVFQRANELYQQHFADGPNRIRATYDLIFLTGWAPAGSQPKPLRPGSAVQRLADALGAAEQPLPDRPGRSG